MMKTGIKWLCAGALCLSAFATAEAAAWRATTGSDGTLSLSAGNTVFYDGSYSADRHDFVLLGWRYPNGVLNGGYSFLDWHGAEELSYMQAPQVDLVNMRANFSSLVFLGFSDNGEEAIGWEVGAHDWVPLTRNADGTYTATWLTPDPTWMPFGGGNTFSFSFAPVPEPASVAFLAMGLPLMVNATRRRSR